MSYTQPIYLLADSQLLFWREEDPPFLERIAQLVRGDSTKAAYIGASNGDKPEFYSIFEAAMDSVGIRNHRMILSAFPDDDRTYLDSADIVLLAGGDVQQGWKVFQEVGIGDSILKRYNEGAVLVGVSAGAVQLGLFGWPEGDFAPADVFETLKLVPFVVSAHDEQQDWESLKKVIQLMNGYVKGVGIPSGAGMIYYPDQSLAPVRHPLQEITSIDGRTESNLLLPVSSKPEESLLN